MSDIHAIYYPRMTDRTEGQEREDSQVLGRHHVYNTMIHKMSSSTHASVSSKKRPREVYKAPSLTLSKWFDFTVEKRQRWTDAA
jgi:hypothetical protein